jgi:hypothetical protein
MENKFCMNSIYKIAIPFLFFIQYLGLGALAQIIILLFVAIEMFNGSKIYLSDADKFLFFVILIIFIFKIIQVPLVVNILVFRFYWGFSLFYLFFIVSKFKIDFLILFWITAIISIIEGVLLNTIMPIGMLKNVPVAHAELMANEIDLGLLKRAYGLASSPTSSANIMVILLASISTFQKEKFKHYFVLITAAALVSFGSGTGFVLFFIFLFVKYELYKGAKLFIGVLVIVSTVIFVLNQDINEGGILMRMSGNYFDTLIELKSTQITEVLIKLYKSFYDTLFGVSYKSIEEVRVMSDFGWIDFLECYGFIGIPLFVCFLLLKKKFFTFPIMIMLVGYFHYAVIGSIPGQILIAGVLSYELCVNKERVPVA